MKTRNIITISVGAAILVVATILLVVGISNHKEAGFVEATNSWDHIPVTVHCTETIGNEGGCETTHRSVTAINSRLGFPMLRWLDDTVDEADVSVTVGVASEPGWVEPGGYTVLSGLVDTYQHCEVTTSNTGTEELLYLVSYHEIGCHCLGLAHDNFDSSICRPVQHPTPSGSFPPSLTDSDREILIQKYR